MISKMGLTIIALLFFIVSSTEAKYEAEQTEIDKFLQRNKYASAAKYISQHPELKQEPQFVRQLTHILVNYYVQAINFKVFSLKDIESGDDIKNHRGKAGSSEIVGGDLEKLLHNMVQKHPDSADINFAVGEYLSRMQNCGCGRPMLFKGASADDFPYFLKAYEEGLYDYWSLFRIGFHYHRSNDIILQETVVYYEKSLELNQEYTPAAYNAAVIYYSLKNYPKAKQYAGMAIEGYTAPDLKADSYDVYGSIELAQKDYVSAENNLKKALELKKWHPNSFIGLNRLYRDTDQQEKYLMHVLDYIALDYSNTYMFNVYANFLAKEGIQPIDKKIYQQLCELELKKPKQIGAINFNLGKMAELLEDKTAALAHYQKAQKVFKTMDEPPRGAVEALDQMIQQLRTNEPQA